MSFWVFDLNLWPLGFWMVSGLLVFSVGVTLFTNWLASGLARPALPSRADVKWSSFVAFVANLIWIVLIFLAGAIAARYIERTTNAIVGYLVFGLVAFLLSLVRAVLYRRVQRQSAPGLSSSVVHYLVYSLFAIVLYLFLALLAHRPANALLFIPLCLGALSPDLDSRTSPLGRLLPFISRPLEARFGHLQECHSLAANILVAFVSAPLILILGLPAWSLFTLGFFAHLLLDLLAPEGLVLFWPLTRRRFSILDVITTPGCVAERILAAFLTALVIVLLFAVDFGSPPPPLAPTLSYDQTVEQYYGMRGSTLVIAHIDGSWQATGRRVRWPFEVLNALGQSFILLDRYTGDVFTAGRAETDNFYLDRITLQAGDPIRVKPVEVRLESQRLADALPVLYEMQRESGLQHIFVSGDVIVPTPQDAVTPTLPIDHSQTTLRRIRRLDVGHYRLGYLTASQLIELADLQVESADLVIVATYTTPATGPTVTPLPLPPATLEPGP